VPFFGAVNAIGGMAFRKQMTASPVNPMADPVSSRREQPEKASSLRVQKRRTAA
jgi:hypothetical protein